MKKTILTSIFLFLCLSFPGAQDFKAILAQIDKQYRFDDADFTVTMTIVAVKPGEEDSVTQVQLYQRAREDRTTVIILKPEISRGTGYLQVGDNLWVYDPESRKFSHSSFKEEFQGSDVKNSDFKPESLVNDYTVGQSAEGKLGNYDTWILELAAVNDEVPVPAKKLWITKDDNLILKQEESSLSGKLVRTVYFPHYTRIGKRYFPDKMLIVDNLNEGEKTQLTYSGLSQVRIPDHYFTKTYLEEVNR